MFIDASEAAGRQVVLGPTWRCPWTFRGAETRVFVVGSGCQGRRLNETRLQAMPAKRRATAVPMNQEVTSWNVRT